MFIYKMSHGQMCCFQSHKDAQEVSLYCLKAQPLLPQAYCLFHGNNVK